MYLCPNCEKLCVRSSHTGLNHCSAELADGLLELGVVAPTK
jgi:hypothetical protein